MVQINLKVFLPLAILAQCALAAPTNQPAGLLDNDCDDKQQQGHGLAAPRAIYFQTNENENAVVALQVSQDGKLSKGTTTKTGGAGSVFNEATTGKPALADPLDSQSSLQRVDDNLFVVNAGSNTLTMLSIDRNNPTNLRVIGQPVAIPGDFPNTVAASAKNRLVCVGTTGAKAGVSCARWSPSRGLEQMDGLRPFDLGQTTPPKGPLNTVSQTFFSPDESTLFTTVKGDPGVNNTGYLSAFKVQRDGNAWASLSQKDTRSSPKGTAVLFGTVPIHDSTNLFVTDASFGATVLSVDGQGQASVVRSQAIDGQKATCWATISKKTKSAYVADAAVDRIVEMSTQDASIISILDLSATGGLGLIDLKSAGDFIYVLSPGNGTVNAAVEVLDVSGGQGSMKLSQHFNLAGIATNRAQGMAVYH